MTPTLIEGWVHLSQHRQSFDSLLWHLMPQVTGLAQSIQTDLGANVEAAWNTFIESGQVWALLIGFFMGYIFRSLTSY